MFGGWFSLFSCWILEFTPCPETYRLEWSTFILLSFWMSLYWFDFSLGFLCLWSCLALVYTYSLMSNTFNLKPFFLTLLSCFSSSLSTASISFSSGIHSWSSRSIKLWKSNPPFILVLSIWFSILSCLFSNSSCSSWTQRTQVLCLICAFLSCESRSLVLSLSSLKSWKSSNINSLSLKWVSRNTCKIHQFLSSWEVVHALSDLGIGQSTWCLTLQVSCFPKLYFFRLPLVYLWTQWKMPLCLVKLEIIFYALNFQSHTKSLCWIIPAWFCGGFRCLCKNSTSMYCKNQFIKNVE